MSASLDRSVSHGRHRPFYFAAVVALLVLPAALWLNAAIAAQLSGITFFLLYLFMIGRRLAELSAGYLRKHAVDTDAPAAIILVVTVGVFAITLASLFVELHQGGDVRPLDLTLSFASVVLGWFTIHTMAAVHYAHIYWRPQRGRRLQPHQRGLEFPQTDEPGIYDFLYFAFIVGMTAQTSDTAITTTEMRKLNLLHAIVSFFFNTVLVAAVVNAAVALAS